MKGLDNWIVGVNDPNAPFNQTDWTEQFSYILDVSDWITDEMLGDDKTYEKLGMCVSMAYSHVLFETSSKDWMSGKEHFNFQQTNKEILSQKAKEIYNHLDCVWNISRKGRFYSINVLTGSFPQISNTVLCKGLCLEDAQNYKSFKDGCK